MKIKNSNISLTSGGQLIKGDGAGGITNATEILLNGSNIGIGTNAAGRLLHVKGSNTVAKVESTTTNVWQQFTCNAQNDNNSGYIEYNSSSVMAFWVNNASKVSIDSTGNLSVASGNIIIGTAGKGIDFSATANATGGFGYLPNSYNEVLTDFEKGNWTPYPEGTTTAGAPTAGFSAAGWYQRIGDMVFVTCYVGWTAHSGTGNLKISNLPFAVAAGAQYYSTGTLDYSNFDVGANNIGFCQAAHSQTSVYINRVQIGALTTLATPMEAAVTFYFSLSYCTNA